MTENVYIPEELPRPPDDVAKFCSMYRAPECGNEGHLIWRGGVEVRVDCPDCGGMYNPFSESPRCPHDQECNICWSEEPSEEKPGYWNIRIEYRYPTTKRTRKVMVRK